MLSPLLQPYRMALHYMSTHGCCLISSNPTGWHCTICLLTAAVSSPPTLQDSTALYVYSRLLSPLLQPYRMALHYMSTHGCCLISSNPTGWHHFMSLHFDLYIFHVFRPFLYIVSIVVSIFQINAKKILKAFLYCYCIDSWIPHVVDPSLSLSQIPVLGALVLTQPETDRAVHLLLSSYSVPILNVVKATLAWTELGGLPQAEKKHRCVTCIGYICETAYPSLHGGPVT